MSSNITIEVPKVSVLLLRAQRDSLVEVVNDDTIPLESDQMAHLDGVINMLDAMIDIGEGYE